MPTSAAPEVARLGLIGALEQIVADEWARAFDAVEWQIENDAEQAARNLPTLTAETIFFATREAIRNAARYGRGEETTRALHLRITISTRDAFQIIVQDDGIGLHKASLQGEQGAGQGLALHSAMLAVIGGTLALESSAGTRVTIRLGG
jgi:signal transduction histidine kinase